MFLGQHLILDMLDLYFSSVSLVIQILVSFNLQDFICITKSCKLAVFSIKYQNFKNGKTHTITQKTEDQLWLQLNNIYSSIHFLF